MGSRSEKASTWRKRGWREAAARLARRSTLGLGMGLAVWAFQPVPVADASATAMQLVQLAGRAAPSDKARGRAVDQITATDANGRVLGTLVWPALVDPARAADPRRPVLVVFNGGPGAGSAWLQLGLLGPLLAVGPEQSTGPWPERIRLVPNPERIDDLADIVFVDPLDTGFSRALPGAPPGQVREWDGDGAYLARSLRTWLQHHGRGDAPVVLMGESYGAERVVAVARHLLEPGAGPLDLAGVVLVSQTVTTEYALRRRDSALGDLAALPTMAASACWHAHDGRDPMDCAARAVAWAEAAQGEGAGTDATRADAISGLTGLDRAVLARQGLGLTRDIYRREALASRGQRLGVYDCRLAAAPDSHGAWQDPSLAPMLGTMERAAQAMARQAWGLAGSPVDGSGYILFDERIHADWRYGTLSAPVGAIDMSARLAEILAPTRARVMIAGGVFDAVGGYGADRYLAGHLGLPPTRVEWHSYPGGHMFYLEPANRAAFLPALRDFVAQAGQAGT